MPSARTWRALATWISTGRSQWPKKNSGVVRWRVSRACQEVRRERSHGYQRHTSFIASRSSSAALCPPSSNVVREAAAAAESDNVLGTIPTTSISAESASTCRGSLIADVDVVLKNQDCAEDFDIGPCTSVEPGTVMALDERGLLQESRHAYDKKVAGVISGAGKFNPGLILGREKGQSDNRRAAVALMGKVYCKVDAQFGEISVGDLLTTSATPGHAMKADDPLKAFGSVIGKALKSMSAGQRGLIPILVALQ